MNACFFFCEIRAGFRSDDGSTKIGKWKFITLLKGTNLNQRNQKMKVEQTWYIYKYINVCIYKYNYVCSTLCSFSRRWNIPNFPPNFISLTPFHPTPPPPSHHHINNVSVADIHTQSHILSEWYGRLVKSFTSSGNPFFREPSWEELQTSHFELPTLKMEKIIWDEQHKPVQNFVNPGLNPSQPVWFFSH